MVKISETMKKLVDVSEEQDIKLKDKLIEIAKKENCAILALIAPYVGVRVTPTKISMAHMGLSEEFGVETVIEKIKESSRVGKLYLLLNSPGGLIQSSYKVARALRNNFKHIKVFIPHIAASGGTLVALTGNELIMGTMSQLTPLDPNREVNGKSISAVSVIRGFENVTEFFKKTAPEDAPYTYKVLAEKYEATDVDEALSIIELMKRYIIEILKGSGYEEKKAQEISDKLVTGFLDHGEVITFEKAKKLGLKVSEPEKYLSIWAILREWLSIYMLQSADKHIIRYITPPIQKGGKNES